MCQCVCDSMIPCISNERHYAFDLNTKGGNKCDKPIISKLLWVVKIGGFICGWYVQISSYALLDGNHVCIVSWVALSSGMSYFGFQCSAAKMWDSMW